ncbi:MAG: SDR family oxidoreductase [Pseudomonadota bacterium]
MKKRIIITGGASGLGAAMAEQLHEQDAHICVIDSDAGALDQFCHTHPSVQGHKADVSDENAVQEIVDGLVHEWGAIDVLCANAGTGGPAGKIEELSYAQWQSCLRVNLDGTFVCARAVIPGMKAQGHGSIIITSSTAGLFGYPHRSPYATAKWGLIGLMKTLAMELGPSGIRVNALAPGAVEGPRMDSVIASEARAHNVDEQTMRQAYVKGVSMRTWVTAQDVANMVIFLLSQEAAKISGQVIAIDGHTETLAL